MPTAGTCPYLFRSCQLSEIFFLLLPCPNFFVLQPPENFLEKSFVACYSVGIKGNCRGGYPHSLKQFYQLPSTTANSWRLFSFVPQNLVNQTYQGNNECTEQEKILICNHCHPLLSFVRRVFPPKKSEGSRLGSVVSHAHNIPSF